MRTTRVSSGSSFFDPFGGKGTLMRLSHNEAVWSYEDEAGNIASCRQVFVDPIIEDNKQALNDSAGKRWGEGKIVASTPLPLYFAKVGEASMVGDTKYIKKFLNDSDYRDFRRFKGTL